VIDDDGYIILPAGLFSLLSGMVDSKTPQKSPFLIAILIALLFLFMTFGGALTNPPKLRSDNTADQFNTARAFSRLENILADQQPHNVDTPENHELRERLLTEIRAMGYSPEVTGGPACNTTRATTYMPCTHVSNVSFRLGANDGPDTGDAIMVTSHYDSVPAGPGATDAGMGTATVLEIAHLLKNETVKRPILFMLTDVEEGGLLGANYFIRDDPQAKDVKTIVNFEARGTRGPAYMFETSYPNSRVIPTYRKGIARPNANSVMTAVYNLIPNTTDVAIYLPEDYEAVNFAVVHGLPYYHTPHDNLANMSQRSFQHMGDLGLSTVRGFAMDTPATSHKNLIYTDILTRFMIVLPQVLALPILIVSAFTALILFWRAKPIIQRWRAFAVPPLVLIGAAGIMWIVQWLLSALRGTTYFWWAHGWATHGLAVIIGMAIILILLRLLTSRANPWHLTFAGWLWFILLGIFTAALLPGASILFVLPAIAFLIAGLTYLLAKSLSVWAFIIASLFTLIIFAPMFAALGITLGYGIAWMIAITTIVTLLPAFAIFAKPDEKTDLPLWTTGAIALLFFALALILPRASTLNPRPLSIVTYADLDKGEAFTAFIGQDRPKLDDPSLVQDAKKREHLRGFGENWSVAAPIPNRKAPSLDITNRVVADDGTVTLTAKIVNADANFVGILAPKSSGISSASFEGITGALTGAGSDRTHVLIRCAGMRCDGAEVEFKVKNTSDGEWLIYGEFFDNEENAEKYINSRPATSTPVHSGDRTIVVKRQNM